MSVILSEGNKGHFFALGKGMEDEADGQKVTMLVFCFADHDEVGGEEEMFLIFAVLK